MSSRPYRIDLPSPALAAFMANVSRTQGSTAMAAAMSLKPPATSKSVEKVVSTLKTKPTTKLFQTVVTIEVGHNKKAFIIHKEFLCFYSDLFRAAFEGSFREAYERKIPLPEESETLFEICNGFLYTNELRTMRGTAGTDLRFSVLILLWVFGDKFLIPALQNKVMDTIIEWSQQVNFIPTIEFHNIYENTVPDSVLRKFVIDLVVYRGDLDDLLAPGIRYRWPKEDLFDLVLTLRAKDVKHQGEYTMPKRDECYYHVHPEGDHC